MRTHSHPHVESSRTGWPRVYKLIFFPQCNAAVTQQHDKTGKSAFTLHSQRCRQNQIGPPSNDRPPLRLWILLVMPIRSGFFWLRFIRVMLIPLAAVNHFILFLFYFTFYIFCILAQNETRKKPRSDEGGSANAIAPVVNNNSKTNVASTSSSANVAMDTTNVRKMPLFVFLFVLPAVR